jgi:hypothetical protein
MDEGPAWAKRFSLLHNPVSLLQPITLQILANFTIAMNPTILWPSLDKF